MEELATSPTRAPPPDQVVPWGAPPAMEVQQHYYSMNPNHGSMGPTIAVVGFIAFLAIISTLFGQFWGGRAAMDMEQWAETKCSSCVDGHVGPPPPQTLDLESGGGGAPNGRPLGPIPVVGIPVMNKTEEDEEIEDYDDDDDDDDDVELSDLEEQNVDHQNHVNLNLHGHS